jgi:hypothetical protein
MTSKTIKFLIGLIILLFLVICAMTAYLVFTPGRQKTSSNVPMSTTTPSMTATPVASSTEPLSASVTVSAPVPNSTVGKTFAVTGIAPNGWYFEAVFPIQVRDPNDNLIATGQGHAQNDWTVAGPVAFTSSITLIGDYSGPADLILLRDNPSGLPENDDEVTMPIVIK